MKIIKTFFSNLIGPSASMKTGYTLHCMTFKWENTSETEFVNGITASNFEYRIQYSITGRNLKTSVFENTKKCSLAHLSF